MMFFWEINFIFMQIFFCCFTAPRWPMQTHSIKLGVPLSVITWIQSQNEIMWTVGIQMKWMWPSQLMKSINWPSSSVWVFNFSSAGRALQCERRGHGFESRWSPEKHFFRLLCNCLNCDSTAIVTHSFHKFKMFRTGYDTITYLWHSVAH